MYTHSTTSTSQRSASSVAEIYGNTTTSFLKKLNIVLADLNKQEIYSNIWFEKIITIPGESVLFNLQEIVQKIQDIAELSLFCDAKTKADFNTAILYTHQIMKKITLNIMSHHEKSEKEEQCSYFNHFELYDSWVENMFKRTKSKELEAEHTLQQSNKSAFPTSESKTALDQSIEELSSVFKEQCSKVCEPICNLLWNLPLSLLSFKSFPGFQDELVKDESFPDILIQTIPQLSLENLIKVIPTIKEQLCKQKIEISPIDVTNMDMIQAFINFLVKFKESIDTKIGLMAKLHAFESKS